MKIAVASDDGVNIAGHTGRCRGFVIYEIADKQAARLEYRENTFTPHARGQCDHESAPSHAENHHSHAPLLDALGDCCVLVSRGMGPRLLTDLAARGIDAFLCGSGDVNQAAEDFAAGRLQRLSGNGCCRH